MCIFAKYLTAAAIKNRNVMLFITTLSIIFLLCYITLIFIYIFAWKQLEPYALTEEKQVTTSVAVIIPARNESERISACLQSIFHQNYPTDLLEIIVIDDYSTDGTAQIVEEWCGKMEHLRLIRLADELPANEKLNSYKKKAIEIAISKTKQQLIVTTDADCLMQPNWLCTLVSFYEKYRPKLMTAPVCFTKETTFFQRFQSLDFMGMMVATGASVHLNLSNMCNGANLSYDNIGSRSNVSAMGNFAYHLQLNSKSLRLSFGASAGINSNQYDFNGLIVNDNTDIHYLTSNKSVSPNFGAGIYLHSNKGYLGFSLPRLIEKSIDNNTSKSFLQRHQKTFGSWVIKRFFRVYS